MKNNKEDLIARRSLVTGLSVAAVGLAAASTTASAHSSDTGFEPARHAQDTWMDELGGSHRAFLDTSTAAGGADALRYGFNILNAHENAYGGSSADYAMIICFRHLSTPFGFNDAMWEKYGEQFAGIMNYSDPATGEAPIVNTLNRGNGPTTITAMADRGVQFAICSAATRLMASLGARATGATTEDVIEELMANSIVNSRYVPAGVMATTRAQEYNYSLLYTG